MPIAKTMIYDCLTYFEFFFAEVCDAKVDRGVLLDGSGSIEYYGKRNFKRCLDFVKKLFSFFPVSQEKAHVGFVLFSTSPYRQFDFKKYFDHASVNTAIDSVVYPKGLTYTGKALEMVKTELFDKTARPGVPHVLLVITDGRATDQVNGPTGHLHKAGVTVISFGIGKGFDKQQLIDMASEPKNENVIEADFQQMESVASKIKDIACKGKTFLTEHVLIRDLMLTGL